MSKKKPLPISFVIASLGNSCLFNTLDSIIGGEYIPREIIVVLPPYKSLEIDENYKKYIKIINSIKKGQVAQRAFGFKFCSEAIIIQCDDDILFKNKTLMTLFHNFNHLGTGNILGPIYVDMNNSKNITTIKEGLLGFFVSLYHKYISLAPWSFNRMGALTSIGIGYGVDPSKLKSKKPYSVKWLNGGCVLSHKEDLILDDYFPFEGKAYFEDTIHSILWNKNNKKLWVIPDAICYQIRADYLSDDLKSYKDRFKIHKYIVKMLNGNFFNLYIWEIFFLIKICFLKLFKK